MRRISLVLLCLLASAPRVRATGETTAARGHYIAATKAYDVGDYDEAVREFSLAYKLRPDPSLLYNLGQAHRLAGHPNEALRAFRTFLSKVPTAPNRAEVQRRIDELTVVTAAPAPVAPAPVVVPPPVVVTAPPPAPAVVLGTSEAVRAPSVGKSRRRWVVPVAVVSGVVVVGLAVGLGLGLGLHPSDPHADSTVRF